MSISDIRFATWDELKSLVTERQNNLPPGECLWFRGCGRADCELSPTLMRDTAGLSDKDHDQLEADTFFEFQARAGDLRHLNLNEWEYLFYGRHFGVATRVLDWTDTIGVALYFALEKWIQGDKTNTPSIWMINPYDLNEETWDVRDIILPRYLGLIDNEYLDYGELLLSEGPWAWDGPVAIYPIQINERVRAQRGWFTIHGNNRNSLEKQLPKLCTKYIIDRDCAEEALIFLQFAGFNQFSIYPDLDNLAKWIRSQRLIWAATRK